MKKPSKSLISDTAYHLAHCLYLPQFWWFSRFFSLFLTGSINLHQFSPLQSGLDICCRRPMLCLQTTVGHLVALSRKVSGANESGSNHGEKRIVSNGILSTSLYLIKVIMWAETWKILGTVDTSFCAAAMHFVHLKKMHLVDSTGIQCAGDDY